jgi:hypothetical protein
VIPLRFEPARRFPACFCRHTRYGSVGRTRQDPGGAVGVPPELGVYSGQIQAPRHARDGALRSAPGRRLAGRRSAKGTSRTIDDRVGPTADDAEVVLQRVVMLLVRGNRHQQSEPAHRAEADADIPAMKRGVEDLAHAGPENEHDHADDQPSWRRDQKKDDVERERNRQRNQEHRLLHQLRHAIPSQLVGIRVVSLEVVDDALEGRDARVDRRLQSVKFRRVPRPLPEIPLPHSGSGNARSIVHVHVDQARHQVGEIPTEQRGRDLAPVRMRRRDDEVQREGQEIQTEKKP